MTDHGPSRKHASILGGVNASKACLFGLLLLAAACQGDMPARPDQALVESVSEAHEAARPERERAQLTRIDVYGAGGETAAGARVVRVLPGGPAADSDVKPGEVATVEGDTLTITTTNGVMVDNAKVIKTDIVASNGVIHVIDSVVMPN